jgi:hypothetical protein
LDRLYDLWKRFTTFRRNFGNKPDSEINGRFDSAAPKLIHLHRSAAIDQVIALLEELLSRENLRPATLDDAYQSVVSCSQHGKIGQTSPKSQSRSQ